MTIWFTADTHFSHGNIIRYCQRPFANLREMDETMIINWNALVRQNDTVYHLGDFCLGSEKRLTEIRGRLNGNICLCLGNHDKIKTRVQHLFGFVKDVHYFKYCGHTLFLSHYGHRVWRNSHHGSIHLYGHSHGNLPAQRNSFDVGVDCWRFRPISFDEVIAHLPRIEGNSHDLDRL